MKTSSFTRLNKYLSDLPSCSLTSVDQRWLMHADKLAVGSLHSRNKVGAVIFSRGRMISSGVNEEKTHPYQAKWNKYSCHLHAEISAIIDALKFDNCDFARASIAVSRIGKGKKPLCSYPCNHCWPALSKIGIRRIVCYDCNGFPVSVRG